MSLEIKPPSCFRIKGSPCVGGTRTPLLEKTCPRRVFFRRRKISPQCVAHDSDHQIQPAHWPFWDAQWAWRLPQTLETPRTPKPAIPNTKLLFFFFCIHIYIDVYKDMHIYTCVYIYIRISIHIVLSSTRILFMHGNCYF